MKKKNKKFFCCEEERQEYISSRISEKLAGYPDFQGVSFVEEWGRGISLWGKHKQIPYYNYGQPIPLEKDSDEDKVIDDFVEMWKHYDKPDTVRFYQNFIEQGRRWGWD